MTNRANRANRAMKRSTKTPAQAPEPVDPVLVVDEAPPCELCGEPSGEGNALCPACADTDDHHRSTAPVGLAVDEGAQEEADAAVEVPVTPVMTRGQGKSAKSLLFYIRREQRRGWTLSDSNEQGLIDLAREAWHEAVDDREAQQEAGA